MEFEVNFYSFFLFQTYEAKAKKSFNEGISKSVADEKLKFK